MNWSSPVVALAMNRRRMVVSVKDGRKGDAGAGESGDNHRLIRKKEEEQLEQLHFHSYGEIDKG